MGISWKEAIHRSIRSHLLFRLCSRFSINLAKFSVRPYLAYKVSSVRILLFATIYCVI